MGLWGQSPGGENSLGTMLLQGAWFQGHLNPGPGVLEAFALVSQGSPWGLLQLGCVALD